MDGSICGGIACGGIAVLIILAAVGGAIERIRRDRNRDLADQYLAKKYRDEEAEEQARAELARRRKAERESEARAAAHPAPERGLWDDRPANAPPPTHCPKCGGLNRTDAVTCSLCGVLLRSGRRR